MHVFNLVIFCFIFQVCCDMRKNSVYPAFYENRFCIEVVSLVFWIPLFLVGFVDTLNEKFGSMF